MNQREMFEKSFQRPSNYFELSARQQWDIDKSLGILDWEGEGPDCVLTEKDKERWKAHYNRK